MPRLYLMRHGQTEFNLKRLVQGRCDSPLTDAGVEQAREAGRWLAGQNVSFKRLCSSPLPRAARTLDIVREELVRAAGGAKAGVVEFPAAERIFGLIERCYGSFEEGPQADVPASLWDPGEELVPYGGEGSRELQARMVATLTQLMDEAAGGNVLAVSHGSATLQFKLAWADLAQCDQDVSLGNCCVLIYEYDPASKTFVNTRIRN